MSDAAAAAAASPFAAIFDAPELSDVLLCVYTGAASAEEGPSAKKIKREHASSAESASGAPARSYHCHSLVLSVLSGFFKAQLSRDWNQGSTAPDTAAQRTVDIHVEAEELDALHELLQLMYRQTLPAVPPTAPLFLQCLKLADRFGAVSSIELLVAGLAGTHSAAIDYALLSYVFSAPPGVCVSRAYTSLLDSCSKAVVRLFGDVPAVIKDEALLQQFCSLPHAAVLAWIKSDDLQVHSENCVVLLVSAWVQANQDSTAAQHEELANETRVFDLGPTYLHDILPILSWFKGCSNMEFLPAVQSCARAGIRVVEGLQADKGKVSTMFAFPPGWLAKPRKHSSASHTGSWVLSSSQLKQLDDDKLLDAPAATRPLYTNGFMMRLLLVVKDSSTAPPGKTLGIYVGIDGPVMKRRGVSVPGKALIHMGTTIFKAGSSGSKKRFEGVLAGSSRQRLYDIASSNWGRADTLSPAAPTVLELVAPYVHEEQLHIEATVAAIDT